ncbi:thioesterase-like superfamily-domain-containing protein [Infundibulicybe gibba]|nr:thioesterase-like superfamily-domain-containing protein [Infundibulicybe gibba]
MAPLHQALKFGPVYQGSIDPQWSVGAYVVCYVLALIVDACVHHQQSTTHPDPIHVTAHYLRTSSISPFEIHIRVIKHGKGFTNLSAELQQKGVTNIMTHLIFGVNAPSPMDKVRLSIDPPSRYARRHPLKTHPAKSVATSLRHTWVFHPHVKWAEEAEVLDRNKVDSPNRTDGSTVGGGGLDWGAWFRFSDKEDKITNASLAFLVDIFQNLPTLLPKSERIGLTTRPFEHTVGLYSTGRFLTEPQGRHDAYVEVWTAPTNIGEGEVDPNWRDKQVCLAVATQMALTIPIEVNRRKGRGGKL